MPVWKLDDGLTLGKVLKPNGYLGFVKVAFFMSGLEDILDIGDFLFIEWMEKPVPYHIEEILWEDDKTARIKFAGIQNDEEAKKITGRHIILSEKTIPPDLLDQADEGDLVGFKVIDLQKNVLGTVTGLDERGPQSLLEVDHEGRELLIPVHEDLIKKVDGKKRIITVDLPPGLLEL